jgi:Mn-dependent DtxR family transcriptional regulator
MATTTSEMMRLQLPTDKLILEKLQEGRNLGANIAEDIDRHQKTVTHRLRQLQDYGAVDNIGRGVYEITPKGEAALRLIDQYDESEDFEALVESELDPADE